MARILGYNKKIYQQSSVKEGKLGQILESLDGSYRYAQAGAVNLAAGRLVQSVVPTANHKNIAVAVAAPVDSLQITVTLGATAVTANEYADGIVYVNDAGADTTTEGYKYRIKSHPAAAASGTLVLTLAADSPIKIALTTNSEVTLVHNKFYGLIIHPSPPTALPVGVTPMAVTAAYYFWVQVSGLAVVLQDGTVVIGQSVMPSDAVDGAVEPWALTEGTPNVEITPAVGRVMVPNATTEECLIELFLEV